MKVIPMNKQIPALRLILTYKCNGKCAFCHREGYDGKEDMSIDDIVECINIAKKLSVPIIALTGGEPTLRDDLSGIISLIRHIYPESKVHLTTNGIHLSLLQDTIDKPIDKLNVSISSLNIDVAKEYQGVNPNIAIDSLLNFPALHKNLNFVVDENNFNEIRSIIDFCIKNNIALVLMFDLSDNKSLEYYKQTINIVKNFGKFSIEGTTPRTLVCNVNNKMTIKIKHPLLSRKTKWTICKRCSNSDRCGEGICAVRVHPDGVVTPCLDKTVCAQGHTLSAKISKIYDILTMS